MDTDINNIKIIYMRKTFTKLLKTPLVMTITVLCGLQTVTAQTISVEKTVVNKGESINLKLNTDLSGKYIWYADGVAIDTTTIKELTVNNVNASATYTAKVMITHTSGYGSLQQINSNGMYNYAVGDIVTTDNLVVKPNDWNEAKNAPYNKNAQGLIYHISDTTLRVMRLNEIAGYSGAYFWDKNEEIPGLPIIGRTPEQPYTKHFALADFDGRGNSQAVLYWNEASGKNLNWRDCIAVWARDSANGYVPALGEMDAMVINQKTLDPILIQVGGTPMAHRATPFQDQNYWTSSDSATNDNNQPTLWRVNMKKYNYDYIPIRGRSNKKTANQVRTSVMLPPNLQLLTKSVDLISISALSNGVHVGIPCLNFTTPTTTFAAEEMIESRAQHFTLSGIYLSEDVTVTAPAGFEISLMESSDYNSSVILKPTDNSLSHTSLYVRLKSGTSIGSHSGNITITSGSENHTIAIAGLVTPQSPTCPTLTSSSLAIIPGESITLTATPGHAQYIWYAGTDSIGTTNTNTFSVKPAAITSYTVKVIDKYTLDAAIEAPSKTKYTIGDIVTTDGVVVKCIDWEIASAAPFYKVAKSVIYHVSDTILRAIGLNETHKEFGKSGEFVENEIFSNNNRTIALTDFDGRANTKALLTKYPNSDYAANWCHSEGGYLAAIGELQEIVQCRDIINTSLKTIDNELKLLEINSGVTGSELYSSSSECNIAGNWVANVKRNMCFSISKQYRIYHYTPYGTVDPKIRTSFVYNPSIPLFTPVSDVTTLESIESAPLEVKFIELQTTAPETNLTASSGTAGIEQSFTVAGNNLTGSVTVIAPAGFEISKTQTGRYSDNINLTPESGILVNTTLWVRLTGTNAGSYIGNITVSSSGISQVIAVAGLVGTQPATPTLAADMTVISKGESTNLTAIVATGSTANTEYIWYADGTEISGEIGNVITVTPILTTNYTVTAVNRDTLNTYLDQAPSATNMAAVGDIITTDNLVVKPIDWKAASAAPYNKVAIGVIYHISDTLLRAIGLNEAEKAWGMEGEMVGNGIFSDTDETNTKNDFGGKNNTAALLAKYPNSDYAANWCDAQGGYLPSLGELLEIKTNQTTLNNTLTVINATPISKGYHWSSAEWGGKNFAWTMVNTDYTIGDNKSATRCVRSSMAYPSSLELFNNLTITTVSKATSEQVAVYIKYTLTFETNEGTVNPATKDVISNIEIGELPTLSKTGYTFNGWKIGETVIDAETVWNYTEDQTAIAQWTINNYTIKFANYDNTELQKDLVEYGQAPVYTGETPTKVSTAEFEYVFTGWTPEIAIVTDNAIYTATFTETKRSYTLAFDTDGGEVIVSTINVVYGDALGNLPIPRKIDYIFDTWKIDNDAITAETIWSFDENKTAVAQWIKDETVGVNTDHVGNINIYSYANRIHIASKENIAIKSVQIHDMLDRIVYEHGEFDGSTIISTHLPAGFYMVRLITEAGEMHATKVYINQ